MAEVAGLVVGGIGLTTMVDQCISMFAYIDSGRNCTQSSMDATMRLILLGCRLRRWEQSLQRAKVSELNKEVGDNVKFFLQHIHDRLEKASQLGEKYVVSEASDTIQSKAVAMVIEKLQDLQMSKSGRKLSITKKARWALHDEGKLNELVSKIDEFISSLEKLTPDNQPQRVQMAGQEASMIQQLENMEGFAEALKLLRSAANRVDQDFNAAAGRKMHSYQNIQVEEKSVAGAGDYYGEEWLEKGGVVGAGGSNSYDDIRVSGSSKVRMGNQFGGKDPLA